MPKQAPSENEPVPLMTRLPKRIHSAVKAFSAGNGKRPRASLNDTIIFLLAEGLAKQGVELPEESTPGNRAPQSQAWAA
jgi:hypothetical protein